MKLNLEEYSMEHKEVKTSGKFINRELSWIDFNERVLYYSREKETPLNERFRFLSITDSNLNEFISVRLSYARKNKEKEPYRKIVKKVKNFIELQNASYDILKYDLKKKGMEITKISKLDKKEIRKIENAFINDIFPLLTPINIGSTNQNIRVENGQLCISSIIMEQGRDELNIIPISNSLDKTIIINDKKVVLIEDVIQFFIDKIFINKKVISTSSFKIIKDQDTELSHDRNTFILDRMLRTIATRSLSNPIFMVTEKGINNLLKEMLINALQVPKNNVVESKVVDFTRFSNSILGSNNSYTSFEPNEFQGGNEIHYSIFNLLHSQDVLLHHPYDSYETVVKFIEHAAFDPDVLAIKQTLYRVSSIDSPIINALCNAAKNGKHVAVLIEIKARFDEMNNIRLISKLKESGVIVILGLERLKTHCKMCLVVREEDGKKKIYSHIGTGNYNEKTSRIYTDLSYLTSKQKIGMDLLNVFNIISGNSAPDEKLQKIAYSPVTLRKTLLKCIDREISIAKKKKSAEIFIKVNSLSDPIMVNKLYEAADKGVKVYIICRGICSIVPRENIFVKSIVGRFLEHSRIYYFKNDKNSEYFLSSADLLTRNLDKRVETLVSVKDSNVVKKLEWIIKILKKDERNSFIMTQKGLFGKMKGTFDSHQYLIDHSK